jgi:hypothetical protein
MEVDKSREHIYLFMGRCWPTFPIVRIRRTVVPQYSAIPGESVLPLDISTAR